MKSGYNTVYENKGNLMEDIKRCTVCNKRLSKADVGHQLTVCKSCRKEAKIVEQKQRITEEVESVGIYRVLEVTRASNYKVKVECKTCGTLREAPAYSLKTQNPKCIVCEPMREGLNKYYALKDVGVELGKVEIPEVLEDIGIYQITIGDKKYVGSSRELATRINRHTQNMRRGKSNVLILNALAKCKDIKFDIVEYCTSENLVEREQYYIDTISPELNIADTAANGVINPKKLMQGITSKLGIKANKDDYIALDIIEELLVTSNIQKVADKFNTTYHVVAGISSGKTCKWLEQFTPHTYKKVMLTRGSRYSYNDIRKILTLKVQEATNNDIAITMSAEATGVSMVLNRVLDYTQRLYEEDEVIRKLYDIIDIQKETCLVHKNKTKGEIE